MTIKGQNIVLQAISTIFSGESYMIKWQLIFQNDNTVVVKGRKDNFNYVSNLFNWQINNVSFEKMLFSKLEWPFLKLLQKLETPSIASKQLDCNVPDFPVLKNRIYRYNLLFSITYIPTCFKLDSQPYP